MVSEMSLSDAVIEVSMLFESRYGHLWVGGHDESDRDGLREKLRSWTEELTSIKATPAEIVNTGKFCVNMQEFKNYPPVLNNFIINLKEYRSMFSSGDKGKLYLAVKRLDEVFGFTYNGLWNESSADKQKRKIEYWCNELFENNIDSKTVSTVTGKIKRKGEFRVYPPSLNAFLLECQFTQKGHSLGDPEEMFNLAILREYDRLDIIAEGVISELGTHRIKMQPENGLRKQFIEMYYSFALRYLSNPELFVTTTDDSVSGNSEEEPVPEDNFFSSFLN
tara:strand:- start:5626 stop:6459 length:834 start_codon:yes stop_codon:yes gene_type:complete